MGKHSHEKTPHNKIGLSGLSFKSMRQHYAIIPLFGMCVVGAAMAGSYLFRLATKHPEVTWSTKRNPEPWNEYSNKQYKFLGDIDYRGVPPNYKTDANAEESDDS